MTFRIFQEPTDGIVRHTAASKLLAEDPMLRQWAGMISEELWPAATRVSIRLASKEAYTDCRKTVDALAKWPACEEPNQTVSSTIT